MKDVTKDTFNTEVGTEGIKVVKFYSTTCGPCKMLNPLIPEVEAALGIEVLNYNIEEGTEISDAYDVMKVPQILVLKDGEEVERLIGYNPAEVMIEKLKAHIPG